MDDQLPHQLAVSSHRDYWLNPRGFSCFNKTKSYHLLPHLCCWGNPKFASRILLLLLTFPYNYITFLLIKNLSFFVSKPNLFWVLPHDPFPTWGAALRTTRWQCRVLHRPYPAGFSPWGVRYGRLPWASNTRGLLMFRLSVENLEILSIQNGLPRHPMIIFAYVWCFLSSSKLNAYSMVSPCKFYAWPPCGSSTHITSNFQGPHNVHPHDPTTHDEDRHLASHHTFTAQDSCQLLHETGWSIAFKLGSIRFN
jgi:hypothetical protein